MKKILISLCVLSVAGYNSTASAENKHGSAHHRFLDRALERIVNAQGNIRKPLRYKRLDRQLRRIINDQELTGNPLLNRTVPDISSLQAQLGMDLFFSKTLGGDRDSACVTCHHPSLGGGDNLSLPIGVEAESPDLLGLGRTSLVTDHNDYGEPMVPRNAPTTFNVVAWDKFQFHDGRVESLDKTPGANGAGPSGIRTPDSPFGIADELAGNNLVHAQARFPVTSREEMKGFYHDDYDIRYLLAGRLGGYGPDETLLSENDKEDWLTKFRAALSSPRGEPEELITEQNVSMLIAEYERSQAFVETPWKRYIEGDRRALSKAAKKGALLFYRSKDEGGANCSSCHSGDFFTDESFHNLAMPQIGAGKGDGDYGDKDYGRGRETVSEEDKIAFKFAFRTPSLLNVEVTGPWSHAGAYASLEAVVKHHLNAAEAVAEYDASQLAQVGIFNRDKMLENTGEALSSANFELETIDLNNREIHYLVEFLKALTDPCTQDRECLEQWIPDSEGANDDQLNAVDQEGNVL